MSTTATIEIAAPPTTAETVVNILEWLFASTGTPSDFNIGSIVRTYSEAIGATQEIEGISVQSQALQALIYSAYSAFGISPLGTIPAVGTVTFSTLTNSPLPPNVSVNIPLGTILQTPSGVQFSTTATVTLVSGTTTVNAPVQGVTAGAATNVAAGQINQTLTSLSFPLAVTNLTPTAGGQNAETPSATLARFTAFVFSLGLASPEAIAGAVVGVTFGLESVRYASVYEPWIAAIALNQTPNAGFQVYIDNGSGAASPGLISTVYDFLSSGGVAGYRPAGVPYSVLAVNPVYANVAIAATSLNSALAVSIEVAVAQAVSVYFASLNFGFPAELTQLIATVANATFGQLATLSVVMNDINGTTQQTISTDGTQRIVLLNSTIIIS